MPDYFDDILLVLRLQKLGVCLASSVVLPLLALEDTLDEVKVAPAVNLAKGFELVRKVELNVEIERLMVEMVDFCVHATEWDQVEVVWVFRWVFTTIMDLDQLALMIKRLFRHLGVTNS